MVLLPSLATPRFLRPILRFLSSTKNETKFCFFSRKSNVPATTKTPPPPPSPSPQHRQRKCQISTKDLSSMGSLSRLKLLLLLPPLRRRRHHWLERSRPLLLLQFWADGRMGSLIVSPKDYVTRPCGVHAVVLYC